MKQKRKIVAIAAGGTGGHVFPAIAVSEQLLNRGYKIVFITDIRGQKFLDSSPDIIRRWNFEVVVISLKPSAGMIGKIMSIPAVILNIAKIVRLLWKQKVEVALGFGSYVSLPTILAARLLWKKALIHEQNSHMGLANRLSLWFCEVGMGGFAEISGIPKLIAKRMIFTGIPVRREVKELHYQNSIPTINYEAFFKIYDKINILIIGGSQGTSAFNVVIPQAISNLDDAFKEKLRIFHQCRNQDVEKVKNYYENGMLYADVRPFFTDIATLMSKAHILISRAGGSIIAEILTLGTPSILIPYPQAAANHQVKNASYLQNHGAAIVVRQEELTITKLDNLLTYLFSAEGELGSLSAAAKEISEPDADLKIVRVIEIMLGIRGNDRQENYNKIFGNIGIS